MRKRSEPDIIATILDVANGGVGKTRLLTKANLTSLQFKRYINLLLEKKLVLEANSKSKDRSYKTTELGLRYLELYNSIKSVSYLNA